MRRSPQQKRNRRLALIGLIGMGLMVVVLVWMDLPASLDQRGLSGSMMEEEASLAPSVAWATGSMAATMDDDILVSWPSGMTLEEGVDELRLFASRDANWNPVEDYALGNWAPSQSLDGQPARFAPRHTPCLDAGPWFLFAVHNESVVHAFSEALVVENGPAGLERTGNIRQVGHKGELEVMFEVHRPATTEGFDGLHEHPVEVWVTNGKVVCVASAAPLNVSRVALRSTQSWHSTEHAVRVSLDDFQRVRDFSPFEDEQDVPAAADVAVRGDCDLDEGEYQVLVGPTEEAWANTGQVMVHAPPTEVDSRRIEVSVPAGQVVEANVRLRNRSERSLSWSARAVSSSDGKWLIGADGQMLRGGKREEGVISISALDLSPGRYTADLRVVVDDFYGTEVLVPVEINVLTARSRTAGGLGVDDDAQQPGSIQLGNYPNPFSASTTIRMELPEGDEVRIHVYDMTGREVRMLHDGYLSMGVHEFRFDADDLPSGTYLYRVSSGSGQETGTMTLIR